jgi:hypothetical protein
VGVLAVDHARELRATELEVSPCPACAAPGDCGAALRPPLVAGLPLRRCQRCGHRSTRETPSRSVTTCAACDLPFVDETGTGSHCPTCREDPAAADPPAAGLALPAEAAVRAALAAAWSFVGAPDTSRYLIRVLRQTASRIGGAPRDGEVVLARHPSLAALALPSGTVILTTTTLEAIDDEAELAFVLAHELWHVASGAAASSLSRLGLRAVARGGPPEVGWLAAADDLLCLGHGDRAEHRADRAALEAIAAAGYEPQAAARYLERLDRRVRAGDVALGPLALAHPPAADRRRRVDALRSRLAVRPGTSRLDREVFRRAAGPAVLSERLVPVRPFDEPSVAVATGARPPWRRPVWVGAGALLLIGIVAMLLRLLLR